MDGDLKSEVFFLIRGHDVELAEGFNSQYNGENTLAGINGFMHLALMRIGSDRADHARATLTVDGGFDDWKRNFSSNALHVFMKHRWPQVSTKEAKNTYMS